MSDFDLKIISENINEAKSRGEDTRDLEASMNDMADHMKFLSAMKNAEGERDEAFVLYMQVLDVFPEDTEALTEAGNFFFGSEDYEKAMSFFDRALISEPDDANLLLYAGITRFSVGKYSEAEKYLRSAKNCGGDEITSDMYLAVICMLDERFTEAQALMLSVVEKDDEFEEAYNSLVELYKRMGNTEEAKKWDQKRREKFG